MPDAPRRRGGRRRRATRRAARARGTRGRRARGRTTPRSGRPRSTRRSRAPPRRSARPRRRPRASPRDPAAGRQDAPERRDDADAARDERGEPDGREGAPARASSGEDGRGESAPRAARTTASATYPDGRAAASMPRRGYHGPGNEEGSRPVAAERRLTHRLPFPDRRPTVGGDTERVPTRSAHVFVTDARTRRRTRHRVSGRDRRADPARSGRPPRRPRRSRAPSRSSPTGTATAASTRSSRSTATRRRSAPCPVDVLDYSNAKEDILRALQFARQNKPDPGPTGGGQTTDTNGHRRPGSTTRRAWRPGRSGRSVGRRHRCIRPRRHVGPLVVPIPLFILGGLALLLLAAGGAGYLSRRAQARREGGPTRPRLSPRGFDRAGPG